MGQPSIITKAVHETGTVWGIRVPYPDDDFISDFGWEVYDSPQHRLPFQAYAMRKLKNPDGSFDLNMRFVDKSQPPLGPNADVTVKLFSPSV